MLPEGARVAIPAFREDGWLPEGHWQATWEEIEARFAGEPGSRRQVIQEKLVSWRDSLRAHRVTGRLILDGSFISAKESPGDCDCLFVYDDSHGRLDEDPNTKRLTDYSKLKAAGLGDVFVFPLSLTQNHPSLFVPDVFDYHKETRLPKGVVEVEI
jgi:hypothetical protein